MSLILCVACLITVVTGVVIGLGTVGSTTKHIMCIDSKKSTSNDTDDDMELPMYIKSVLFWILVSFLAQLLVGFGINIIFFIRIANNIPFSNNILEDSWVVLYICGRYGMVLLFIGRLYYSFDESFLQISFRIFILIITYDGIVVLCFIIIANMPQDFSFYAQLNFISGATYMISDVIVNTIMLIMFVKRLKILKGNTVIDEQYALYTELIRKYTYLVFMTIASTLICFGLVGTSFMTVFGTDMFPMMVGMSFNIDAIINIMCAYLSMGFSKEYYKKYCIKPERICCKIICN